MRVLALLSLLFCVSSTLAELPRVGLSYVIDARFDPVPRAITGRETVRWRNDTGETVAALPLHLYLNAFAHTESSWIREGDFRDDVQRTLSRDDDPWGWNEPRAVRQLVDGVAREAAWRAVQPDDGNPLDRTLGEITLPRPVPPGGEAVLEIEFEARLPRPFARTGQTRDFALVGQWFPKLGVIEPPGVRGATRARLAARQFHGTAEFYADYADYDVTFTAPDGWLVGATGRRQGEPQPDGKGALRHRYVQRAVHDFALVAGRRLVEAWHRHAPKGGGPAVDVRYIVPRGTEHQVPRWRRATEGSLDVLGARVGPYPYDVLTVVLVPFAARETRGMEYPTFVTAEHGDPIWDAGPFRTSTYGDHTIVHEVAHQYFYGLIGNDEQEEAFLDEGFSSYWQGEIAAALWGRDATYGRVLGRKANGVDVARGALASPALREPIRRGPAWLYAPHTWGAQLYVRPALALETASRMFGRDVVDRVFREYLRRFAFRHPSFDDVLAVAREAGGEPLAAFLAEAFERPDVPDFRVAALSTARWRGPQGRVVRGGETVTVTAAQRDAQAAGFAPPAARDPRGPVVAEVRDPGWTRPGRVATGRVEHRVLAAERAAETAAEAAAEAAAKTETETETAAEAAAEAAAKTETDTKDRGPADALYASAMRVEGPGWNHLPVTLEFRFDDGAVVTDRWDARAPWREYRFLRPARLLEARIDPEDEVVLDPTPGNNGRASEPDQAKAADWGLFIGALAQALAAGLAQWL